MKFLTLLFILIANCSFGQQVDLLSKHLNIYQNVRDFCLSENNEEAFFTIQSANQDLSQIVCVKNGKWDQPELMSFCDEYSYMEPFLTSDGKRLYFVSDRNKNDSVKTKSDFDIWYVERINLKSSWSKPINAGNNGNSDNNEY